MGLVRRYNRHFEGPRPPLTHPVSEARKSRWFYVLGGATLAAFLVQVVTGIALSSSYVTGSGQAYDSLRFITGAPLGSILRGMHYYGSTAMIILIGLHAMRVYLMAAYKYPRQVDWLSGVVLLLGTLLMAFTAQILRWDQGGFWTAVVAAEQAGRAPLIENWLGHFILAGATPGGATLSRFFAAHVFFIPAVLFSFIAVHLYLVVHNGISEPPKAGRPVAHGPINAGITRSWSERVCRSGPMPRGAIFSSGASLSSRSFCSPLSWVHLRSASRPTLRSSRPPNVRIGISSGISRYCL